MTKSRPPERKADFEQSIRKLEELLTTLESGNLDLESSVAAFEKGIILVRQSQSQLESAEQAVNILIEENATVAEKPIQDDV